MKTTIVLYDDSAALVIHANGDREVFVPRDNGSGMVHSNSPTGLIAKAAIALEDVECAKILQAKLEGEASVEIPQDETSN